MSMPPLTPALSALDPATAPVDRKTARDRLAFVAQFARLVRFYSINNQPEGTWQPFMLKDAAILLATIAATDYRGLNSQYLAVTASHPLHHPHSLSRSLAQVQSLLRLLRHMVSTLAHWLHWLEWQPTEFPLRSFLAQEVAHTLAPDLARTRTIHQALAVLDLIEPPDGLWYGSLGTAWKAAGQRGDHGDLTSGKPEQAVESALADLRHIYLNTLNIIVHMVDAAGSHYATVAAQPTPHPDTALLRVFVDLMGHQQQVLNGIGARHLDFYYRDILQANPRPAQPDSITVLLSPQPDLPIVTVPAGTAFAAGKDADGTPLFFANPDAATINAARIAGAYCLKSDRGGGRFGAGIHAAALADLENIQHDAAGHPVDQMLFCSPQPKPQGLGFALASPMLLLEGGNRSITLTLELSGDAAPPPDDLMAGWQSWMTGPKGWFETGAFALPPAYTPPTQGKPGSLVLEWIVPPDAPAIQVPAKPVDGRDCAWPQVKLSVPPLATAYPWPRVTRINVAVKVRDLTGMSLWSTQAPLSQAAPYPLGPVPQLGSRFLVGSREIFAKPVSRIGLSLEWAAAPTGLGTWYKEYNAWRDAVRPDLPPIQDGSIGGRWHWLEPDGWKQATVTSPAGTDPASLFQGAVKSIFTFQLPDQRPLSMLARSPILAAPAQALAGYLAFTLEHPTQALGHQIYSQVLIWASQQQAQFLMQGAQGKTNLSPPPGAPNPPFTPTLKSATIEYSAQAEMVPGTDHGVIDPPCPLEWHHYGPSHNWLAWQTGGPLPRHAALSPGNARSGLTLVPQIAPEGCLLLAVRGLPAPCTLRLYAAVTDDGVADGINDGADGRGFDIWQYSPQGWKPVEVWQDGTAGLTASGIIELSFTDLPDTLPVSPDLNDCAWLALTPKGQWRGLSVALLATQAVRLVRQGVAADAPDVTRLPPGSIKKSPLPALVAVRQPLGSEGGRGAERQQGYHGADNFNRRVAQRLLHKERALTDRDYVLLAKEHMPDLYDVTVLPMDDRARGCVRLGVVPRIASPARTGAFRPRLSPGGREGLATHLQSMAPDTARISVHNMQPHEVTLTISLLLSHEALAAWPLLRQNWNLALRIFLSPWITSDLPQYDLRLGLVRADLLRRVAAFPGVTAIEELSITVTAPGGGVRTCTAEHMTAPPGGLWVSAAQHALSIAGA